MLGGHRLVIDTFSTVYQLLRTRLEQEFWDLGAVDVVPNTVYVIGRNQFVLHIEKIKSLIERTDIHVVFDNAAEGSSTLIAQLQQLNIDECARNKKFSIISGSDLPSEYAYVCYEHLLRSIVDYEENIVASASIEEIFEKKSKPHTFLFLNGRSRSHRKFLIEKFKQLGLLETALWSSLDNRTVLDPGVLTMHNSDQDLMTTKSAVKLLPREYEYSTYQLQQVSVSSDQRSFVKNELFAGEWGEIYLAPAPYIDTYFSVVTETVFDYPYSFRTEKIAKPLMIGHPFVAVANPGFYQDLHQLGFQTFGHVIDESFDQIENAQDRIDRIAAVVEDLCQQDLASFLDSCYNTCKYNQQHLLEISADINRRFPDQIYQLIKKHG
jgi:hypothetical protein